jgi:hypothetical protein
LGSDHLPISIEIGLQLNRENYFKPKPKIEKTEWKLFTSQCEENINLATYAHLFSLEEIIDSFTRTLKEIRELSIPWTKQYKGKRKNCSVLVRQHKKRIENKK